MSFASQTEEFPNFLVNSLLFSSEAAFSIWSSVTPKALDKITLCNFIYLVAALALFLEFFSLEFHGEIKLFEEIATKLSGYVMI